MDIRRHFNEKEMDLTNQTLDRAVSLTRDYCDIDPKDWKDMKFELKSLKDLNKNEITDEAFAQLAQYRGVSSKASQGYRFNFYRICLQDDKILNAVSEREDKTVLKPLLLYVVTHELIHIVRFNKLQKSFNSSWIEKEIEEKSAHQDTYHILKNTDVFGMDHVLDHYKNHRVTEG